MWVSQAVRRMEKNHPHFFPSAKVLPTPKNQHKWLF